MVHNSLNCSTNCHCSIDWGRGVPLAPGGIGNDASQTAVSREGVNEEVAGGWGAFIPVGCGAWVGLDLDERRRGSCCKSGRQFRGGRAKQRARANRLVRFGLSQRLRSEDGYQEPGEMAFSRTGCGWGGVDWTIVGWLIRNSDCASALPPPHARPAAGQAQGPGPNSTGLCPTEPEPALARR